MRRILALVLLLATVVPATAIAVNTLTVDRRSVRKNEIVTATVTLEGDFARRDALVLPVKNLEVVGEPSISSEFSWTNGETRRTKVFRFRTRALDAGPAQVGPLGLDSGGRRVTLPAIAILVAEDRAPASNDPEVVVRELLADGRDPLFVVVGVEKTRVWVGEPVVVTWWLYNGSAIQKSRILRGPALHDFWVEELDEGENRPRRELVGDTVLEKVPIRSIAVVPLRSGRFEIEGLVIEAAVMRRIRGGPMAVFEGTIDDVTYTSPPVVIDAMPLPAGPPVDATGTLRLQCGAPQVKGRGPVSFEAVLAGRGNVRAAAPPGFATPVPGTLQVEELGVKVGVQPELSMSRRWRYLVFPSRSGTIEIPPLEMTVFDPADGTRRALRCGGGTLHAEAATASAPKEPASPPPARFAWRRYAPLAGALALLLAGLAFGAPRFVRWVRVSREVRRLMSGSPAEVRIAVDAYLEARAAILSREAGEQGEAYRALLSLLKGAERDQSLAGNWRNEASRRLRDLLR